MLIYVGLRSYNEESIQKIIAEDVDGVVLGDGFCNRRMFPYGDYDLKKYINQVLAGGKMVVYQTPCFLTDDKIDAQMQLIEYLSSYDNVMIYVQDLGIASMLSEKYPQMKLCWSRLGKFRVDILNQSFAAGLKELNVDYAEINDPAKTEILISQGIIPCFIFGQVSYQSFGRLCYSMYETDTISGDCGRICLSDEYSLRDTRFGNEISLSGYILGEEYSLSIGGDNKYQILQLIMENNCPVGIYGKDFQDAKHKIKLWKEMLYS